MKEWWGNFWEQHGERTVFMTTAIAISVSFMVSEVKELQTAGQTTLVMILGIVVNKIRSPKNGG